MKKSALIFLLILLLGTSSPAHASFGFFKPSSKLYFLQPTFESVRLFFTFSKQAKIDYLFDLAERRTDEMNIAPSAKTSERYTQHFQRLEEIIGQIENKEQKERVAEKIKEASLHQQEVLAKVYNQVPDEAKEAILNAQENSAKHVEKTIEAVEGTEKAKEYADEAAKIQQIGKLGQIEKLERIQQAPMESSPNADPSQSAPKELKEGRGLLPGKELNPLNPILEQQGENGGNGERMEPAKPVEMRQPAPRQ